MAFSDRLEYPTAGAYTPLPTAPRLGRVEYTGIGCAALDVDPYCHEFRDLNGIADAWRTRLGNNASYHTFTGFLLDGLGTERG